MARAVRAAPGIRRSAAARGRGQAARAARARTAGLVGRALQLLPFTERQLHRIFLALIFAAILAAAWALGSLTGANAVLQAESARVAGEAGFRVRHVRVSGTERMNEMAVYERALAQKDQPMPLLDVAALRQELLALPWVADARVSRRLPDTLAIDIVERREHAVLAKPDRLVLIDAQGRALEPIAPGKVGERLVISGPGAQRRVAALDRLLDAAPALKPQVAGAEWVGNRRWNLTFKTGQLLALPEGEGAAAALVRFARLDGTNRLLGGRVAAIDMRVPGQAAFRCKDGPCSERALQRLAKAKEEAN
ncbi:cell division protein FtsQ/DivIB [Qipengyuania sediminis]|uniref:cell division protein FtsQ/DivIB n=1 Tax=Qipengyuania sediminis TaxID=1532023 RepID=UPI00105A4866|nr:FtsQ-type POTRA domain-containing protein [Qipengyuania sediminis]